MERSFIGEFALCEAFHCVLFHRATVWPRPDSNCNHQRKPCFAVFLLKTVIATMSIHEGFRGEIITVIILIPDGDG